LKLLSFPQKWIVLTVRLRLFSFRYQVSTICYKIFDAHRFDMLYDFHLQMRGQNFRPQNYFGQEKPRYFIDENAAALTFFVHKQAPVLLFI